VQNLHVDNELVAVVIDDKNSNAATTSLEGIAEAGPQVGLINDGDCLLNIAGLSHGNDCEDVSGWSLHGKRNNIPEPSARSRTRYCLKTGPNMV
jgi:hypothetical protein